MTTPSAQELVAELGLRKHPVENGYMSELTYQSSRTIALDDGVVPLADTVYFLYEKGQSAPWHRMRTSDELWIYQAGGTLTIYIFDETVVDGRIQIKRLEPLGLVKIPSGCWFAVEMDPKLGEFCLSTVLLCPGFDIKDFEMADRELESRMKNQSDRDLAKRFFSS